MDRKVMMLYEFYTGLDQEQVKIETKLHSLDYLKELSAKAKLEYCELSGKVYKYKLSGVSQDFYRELLKDHLDKKSNLCAYFRDKESSLFAFNLDSKSEWKDKIKIAALYMADSLLKVGIAPLILKSGHGYHFWCRNSVPVPNSKLQIFMSLIKKSTIQQMMLKGIETNDLQCTCYPRPNGKDVSLRLFGSKHMRTGMFSSVVTRIDAEDTILGEEDSWRYFDRYLREFTLAEKTFAKAFAEAQKIFASE
ncbi:hypothetical protein REC12_04970 [Desulfosporosinus sp. PR]|uniref:hypothetical protein n=1 Tax=Candidatus Desulfosporosinus nitrosoreducens TaxID=3401928 RepID=UPI0027E8C702|nr:hypothetical protein [Desulfosporosinus sp. PR]MDQ7092932.1 hypothetical protein [Desulfosporosinus sp. PR]